ncbi:MAG TPA: cell wall-binding repeat-containing protein, partial [Microbacteriaceae bacterium]
VYIATGTNYPDALSAAPAAAHQGGPLLLVQPNELPSNVKTELKRLAPHKIVVAGGTGVVSTAVYNALKSIQPNIKRLQGTDRYATSRAITEYAFPRATSVYLATGSNFPDALSAGAAAGASAAPVLLANGAAKSLDAATVSLIKATQATKVYIAGGTGVVSTGIENQLRGLATVKRLSGADRYSTSVAVNAGSFTHASAAYLATGTSFPDALAGAALAGHKAAPLYIVLRNCIPQSTLDSILSLGVTNVTLLGGTGVLTTALNRLTLCPPTIKLVPGDQSVTAAWPKITGASSYTVQYSTSSSFKNARSVSAGANLYRQLTGLSNGARYYVRVIALNSSGSTIVRSVAGAAIPDDGYPRLLTVKVVSAGADQVKVSWSGQGRSTKVGVIAGSEGSITKDQFHSSWYPATTTSITLTVPTSLRSKLGTGSGNPIFVKVATYNSTTTSTAMPNVASTAKAYRLSLAGSYAYAGATAPSGTKLRVAEYNVNSVPASAGYVGYTWKDRRTKVAAGIVKSGASVVTTAELTTGEAWSGAGKTQAQDLAGLLAPSGLVMANTIPTGTDGTNGAHIFYKPTVVKRVDGGYVSPKSLSGVNWPSALTNRWFSWAKFTTVATGKSFVVAAVHLPADSGSTSYDALRVREATAINTFLDGKAGSLPTVVMGDFNSSFAAMPNGPQNTFRLAGYYDASSSASHANYRYSTANITRQIDNLKIPGYPFTPYMYQYPAPRIDYIMVKNSPGAFQYMNQLILKSGKFDPAYHGSDHNLQWADLGIR